MEQEGAACSAAGALASGLHPALRDAMSMTRLHQLFLLNLCLQIFDGVATYVGLHHHWSEGNPILLQWMPFIGTGATLLLFKAKACGFLVILRRLGNEPFVYEALVVLATVYTFLSFIPWMARLLSLLFV
jgi:hypothetical protein